MEGPFATFVSLGKTHVRTRGYLACRFTICGGPEYKTYRRAGVAEGIIVKIGGWRARCVFERYAIVSRSEMNDAIPKLQESENRVEQERLRAEEQTSAQIGHNEAISPKPTASRAVNERQLEIHSKRLRLVPGGGVEPPRY